MLSELLKLMLVVVDFGPRLLAPFFFVLLRIEYFPGMLDTSKLFFMFLLIVSQQLVRVIFYAGFPFDAVSPVLLM